MENQRIFKNIYWALLGKLVNVFSSLFVGILVARYLGAEQYGLMNYVISYVTLFGVLAEFGMSNVEIRELSKGCVCKEKLLGTALWLKVVFALITIVFIFVTLALFDVDASVTTMIVIYSFSIILNSFNVIRNYFTSIVLNEYVVKTEITRTIIGAVLKIILLLFHASLIYFIIAFTFDFLLVATGYVYSYKKKIGTLKVWKFDKEIALYYIKQSFPLLLSGTAVIIYQRIDQVMIGNMIDNTSVGYFSTAAKFTDLIIFLPTIITQTLTPLLIRAKERSELEYQVKGQQFVNIIVWISFVLSLFVSFSSYWMIRLTFGFDYIAAVPVLQIMAFKTVGMGLSSSAGQLIIIEKIHQYAFVRNFMACGICISLNLLLIPMYGIVGSAVVTIITVAFSGCIGNLFIPRYHKILRIQIRALLFGWKDLLKIRQIILG